MERRTAAAAAADDDDGDDVEGEDDIEDEDVEAAAVAAVAAEEATTDADAALTSEGARSNASSGAVPPAVATTANMHARRSPDTLLPPVHVEVGAGPSMSMRSTPRSTSSYARRQRRDLSRRPGMTDASVASRAIRTARCAASRPKKGALARRARS